jgi:hypothetical protein
VKAADQKTLIEKLDPERWNLLRRHDRTDDALVRQSTSPRLEEEEDERDETESSQITIGDNVAGKV